MSMAHPARPLKFAIVSPEISILHELSWMLSAVGYTVVTSKDLGEDAAWRQFSDVDFLIFDGRTLANPTPATLAHFSDKPLYRFFLHDQPGAHDLAPWYAAGANDALRVPISRGELLVRARVGARMLEFENRLRAQSSLSNLPGIYSTRGLLRKLNRFTAAGGSVAWGHTLLTTSVDFYADFRRTKGDAVAQELLTTLATSIQQCAGEKALSGYVGDGTFQIVLPGKKAPAARALAEQLATAFRPDQLGGAQQARLSITTAIVPWQLGISPERLLELGQETLTIAKQSGGDCIIDQSTFAQELSNWQNELTVGSPLANVVAQDIMEPFPYVLEHGSANNATLAALRHSGVPVWPFVGHDGRLIGVATPSANEATAEWDHFGEEKLALSKPITIAHNAPFPEIYETFSTEGCPEMVVVADNRPIGYLTFDGFISLIEPINSATFANVEYTEDDSRSLLVGSLTHASERASGFGQ